MKEPLHYEVAQVVLHSLELLGLWDGSKSDHSLLLNLVCGSFVAMHINERVVLKTEQNEQ